MASFMVRKATIDDLETIFEFIVRLARYERLEHEVVATRQSLVDTLFGARPYAEVILGAVDSEPVGFALYFYNYSTFLGKPGLFLEDLFVVPEHRGNGYGKLLLKTLAGFAKQRNCGRMEWNVLTWNEAAISFYQSLGARAQEQWQTYRLTEASIQQLASD